jgi:hypothetical protein
MLSSIQMLRPVPGKPRFSQARLARVIVVILAIAAMLCITAASVSSAHTHLDSAADHCDVCFTAHMAAEQVAVIQVVHSLELQSFLAPPAAVLRVESRSVLAPLTRGPPASL